MFDVVTGYETLGLKVLQRTIKIKRKMREYYPWELESFDNLYPQDYWDDLIKKCCPILHRKINCDEYSLLDKDIHLKK